LELVLLLAVAQWEFARYAHLKSDPVKAAAPV
jgi:hypothetical protein